MDQQNLDEFFSVPIALKEVDNIYGFKVYSSDRLVKAYLGAIKKSGRSNPMYKSIESLVKKKKILATTAIARARHPHQLTKRIREWKSKGK